jgi:hypothetical protein
MALFVDGEISSLQDLRSHETSILDLASSEGIDLGGKLQLAQNDLAIELAWFLERNQETVRWAGVQQVVITEALRVWHTLHALELTYRDAANTQVTERYSAKLTLYAELARAARSRLFEGGVGLVSKPEANSVQDPEYYAVESRRLRRG